jgi:hypothetical protein
MVMARRSERTGGGGRPRTTPRAAGGVRRSPAAASTVTTGLHDPARSVLGLDDEPPTPTIRRPIVRFAAYGMCGDVTATTAPIDPAPIGTWPTTVVGGLAEPADRHPWEHYPGARVAD